MIRTAALIAAWGFFTAQGARVGRLVLAANAVLHNLVLVGAFSSTDSPPPPSSSAAARSARATHARFDASVRLSLAWGFGFGVATTLLFLALGAVADRFDDREPGGAARGARLSRSMRRSRSVIGVFAFTYDGIYIGATWTRDMRNLMLVALVALFRGVVADIAASAIPGCGSAILIFFGARGALQAARYPALARATFSPATARP